MTGDLSPRTGRSAHAVSRPPTGFVVHYAGEDPFLAPRLHSPCPPTAPRPTSAAKRGRSPKKPRTGVSSMAEACLAKAIGVDAAARAVTTMTVSLNASECTVMPQIPDEASTRAKGEDPSTSAAAWNDWQRRRRASIAEKTEQPFADAESTSSPSLFTRVLTVIEEMPSRQCTEQIRVASAMAVISAAQRFRRSLRRRTRHSTDSQLAPLMLSDQVEQPRWSMISPQVARDAHAAGRPHRFGTAAARVSPGFGDSGERATGTTAPGRKRTAASWIPSSPAVPSPRRGHPPTAKVYLQPPTQLYEPPRPSAEDDVFPPLRVRRTPKARRDSSRPRGHASREAARVHRFATAAILDEVGSV
eukprot:TRINITY_DN17606_c0_g1_i3.p1 TRINITY_DN17606_c0_g1~~TRINITY_DN17606_c0_g1_i3.p1  ORF type:complete len:359 (+),score=33.90 TRINITY_DN17606_c0_g1_i3:59-1135(+)